MEKEPFYDETQIKRAECAIRVKDLNGEVKDYPVDSKTYFSFLDNFSNLYCKTVIFKTTEGKRIRGILDDVKCKLFAKETL